MNVNVVAPILHNEIIQFEQEVREHKIKNAGTSRLIVERIKAMAKKIDPSLEISIYGSFATDLCMPWSDIDLVVITNEDSLPNE